MCCVLRAIGDLYVPPRRGQLCLLYSMVQVLDLVMFTHSSWWLYLMTTIGQYNVSTHHGTSTHTAVRL